MANAHIGPHSQRRLEAVLRLLVILLDSCQLTSLQKETVPLTSVVLSKTAKAICTSASTSTSLLAISIKHPTIHSIFSFPFVVARSTTLLYLPFLCTHSSIAPHLLAS